METAGAPPKHPGSGAVALSKVAGLFHLLLPTELLPEPSSNPRPHFHMAAAKAAAAPTYQAKQAASCEGAPTGWRWSKIRSLVIRRRRRRCC